MPPPPHPHLLLIRRRTVGKRPKDWVCATAAAGGMSNERRRIRLKARGTASGSLTGRRGGQILGQITSERRQRSTCTQGRHPGAHALMHLLLGDAVQPLVLAAFHHLRASSCFKSSFFSFFFFFNGANYELMSCNEVAPIKRNNDPFSLLSKCHQWPRCLIIHQQR